MMEKYIDLHTHSIYSDGSMTPAELVRHAKDEGLSAIALSDHDSIGGVAEAVEEGKRIGIEVIPAIELSAEAETETHILGYYIDINNQALLDKLEYVRQVRREREEEICEKLRGLGFDVSMEEVEELAETDVLCRAHFAKLMVAKGYVESVKQASRNYAKRQLTWLRRDGRVHFINAQHKSADMLADEMLSICRKEGILE